MSQTWMRRSLFERKIFYIFYIFYLRIIYYRSLPYPATPFSPHPEECGGMHDLVLERRIDIGCSGRRTDRPRRTAETACPALMILPNFDALEEERFTVRTQEGYT